MSTPIAAREKPIAFPQAEALNLLAHARKIQSDSPHDASDSSENQVWLCQMPHDMLYDQEWTGQLGPMHARRSSEEETHEETGQKRKSSADDNDNIRAAKQRKGEAAETTIKSCEYTSDNADVNKEVNETSEQVLVPQKNVQSVEMTKENTKTKDKENNTAAEAAAPTTEVGQNETIGQKRKLGANDGENVRAAKQTKAQTAETTIKPCEHTADDADAKKKIDETGEEVVAEQKNTQSVEMTKEEAQVKDKGKMRACTKITRSTTEDENNTAAEVAAPTIDVGQNETIGQKRKLGANDGENVRAAKQTKAQTAETKIKPCEHTADDADARKNTDETGEEVVAGQKNVQSVEMTKENAIGKEKWKMRTKKIRWTPALSTIIEEEDEAAEATATEGAAPTTEVDQNQGIGQKRKSSADDNENVRAAKQRKGKMAHTTPKPFNHTPDNTDVKKEIDESSEEVVGPQKNVQSVETTKKNATGENKGKMRTKKIRWTPALSTIIEEDDEAAEATATEVAAPTTELDQNEIADQAKLQREIAYLHQNVQHLAGNYRVVATLDEGNFTTEENAIDLLHDRLDNTKPEIATRYAALNRIYSNISPARVAQKINFMMSLSGCLFVALLMTAFRKIADFFIVTPYIVYEDLLEYLMDMTMVVTMLFVQIVDGTYHLHSHGFTHRDIKPHNLFPLYLHVQEV